MITLILVHAVEIVLKMRLIKGHIDALLELHLGEIRNRAQLWVIKRSILTPLRVQLHHGQLLLTDNLSNTIYRLDSQVDLLQGRVFLEHSTPIQLQRLLSLRLLNTLLLLILQSQGVRLAISLCRVIGAFPGRWDRYALLHR